MKTVAMSSKSASRLAAILTGILAAAAAPAQVVTPPPLTEAVPATDDTEIFFNPASGGTIAVPDAEKPNILFILDTSGSMNSCIPSGRVRNTPTVLPLCSTTGETTRLQELQEAMTAILSDPKVFNGVNAGLMHFGGFHPNQPIFYPIKPLTALASTVDGGTSVTPLDGTGVAKVRDRLLHIVSRLTAPANAGTPITPALYEAARYLSGATVDYGAVESGSTAPAGALTFVSTPDHGVSHRASVSGGTFQNPVGTTSRTCLSATDDLPNPPGGSRCLRIVGTPAPTYISPLTQDRGAVFSINDTSSQPPCAIADYVIFLTDGDPTYIDTNTRNRAWTLTGRTLPEACVANAADPPTTANQNRANQGRCAIELARYLHTPPDNPAIPRTPPATSSPDLRPSQAGQQWVILHTIAFNLSSSANGSAFLAEIANAGGGTPFAANTAEEVLAVFQDIFGDVLNRTSSFATPTFSTNVFNSLFNRNDAYVTVFQPTNTPRWNGNVKKYKLCAPNADDPGDSCGAVNPVTFAQTCTIALPDGSSATCQFGQILDQSGTDILTAPDPVTGLRNVRDDATDFWNLGSADGRNVFAGGAGELLTTRDLASSPRTLYTYTGAYEFDAGDPAQSGGGRVAPTPNAATLTDPVHEIPNLSPADIDVPIGSGLTEEMFGLGPTQTQEMVDIIRWIHNRGVDTNDEDGDSDMTDPAWRFEDPLHASALPIEYGGTPTNPDTHVFVPTNGGGVRMLDGATGAEEWMFIPREMLRIQQTLMTNTAITGTTRTYGLDATPLAWVQDDNDDNAANGVIPNGTISTSENDFVRLIFGQRDGGRAYYAVDVTNPDEPKLIWKIEGGTVAGRTGTTDITPGFADLANTWSPGVLERVRVGTTVRTVLVFGGGNDTLLNNQAGPNAVTASPLLQQRRGNIVYIVDAETGELITSIGGPSGSGAGGFSAFTQVAEMTHPVTGSITAFDSTGDGTTDRFYYGDEGGNVFRADLDASLSIGSDSATVTKLANLAEPGDSASTPSDLLADTRAFYFAPEVVRIDNAQIGGRFDLVAIVSGHRAHPLNGNGQPTYLTEETVENTVYVLKDPHTDALPPASFTPILDNGADLLDVTSNPLQRNIDGQPQNQMTFDAALTELQSRRGWKIQLADAGSFIGEKGFSKPIILQSKMFFTTYIPPSLAESTDRAQTCEVATGKGRLYALDVLTGAALFRTFDSQGDDANLTTEDRYLTTLGPPSDLGAGTYDNPGNNILISFQGEDTPGTLPPGISLPRARIYWNER